MDQIEIFHTKQHISIIPPVFIFFIYCFIPENRFHQIEVGKYLKFKIDPETTSNCTKFVNWSSSYDI